MTTETILPFLCELFVKSLVVLLVGTLVVAVWRGATAAQRHLVWFAAIVTILGLPMTRWVSPHWAVPLERQAKMSLPRSALQWAPIVESVPPAVPAAAAPPPRTWTIPDYRKILPELWLGGVIFLLGYRWLGNWRLHRLERNSLPADDARIERITSAVLRELNITRRVRVRISKECPVPMTWGSLRPVLMLPAEAMQWNEARLLNALRHEAGHICRHDHLGRWITQLACALYWPNPFVWFAARALRIAQEQATDDLVLRSGSAPDEYAAQLLEVARSVAIRGSFAGQAVAMACPSTLAVRVTAIVDERRDRSPLSRRATALGSIVVAASLALSTVAQLRGDDRTPGASPDAPAPAPAEPSTATIGFTDRTTLRLGTMRVEEMPDEDSARHLTLYIPIKVLPGTKVNVRDLVIHVLFYDLIDGQTLAPTAANVNSHWVSSPPDWTRGDTEELAVEYRLPRPKSDVEQRENRKYFGYVVRLYYQHQLQAATAEPERLSHQYPAPQTLPAEEISKAVPADSGDPEERAKAGDMFVDAYLAIQKAEKLEAQHEFKRALSGMKAALKTLDEISQLYPSWQPQIMPYRKGRTRAAIDRIAALGDTQLIVNAEPAPPVGDPKGKAVNPASSPDIQKVSAGALKLTGNGSNGSEFPVTLEADQTRMENGVGIAEGKACLKYGAHTISADTIRYDTAHGQVKLSGHVEIKDGPSLIQADELEVFLKPDGKLAIVGAHKTSVGAPPVPPPVQANP